MKSPYRNPLIDTKVFETHVIIDGLDNDELRKWLEKEIFRLVSAHERLGGVTLSTLMRAFDPDKSTLRHKDIEKTKSEWFYLSSRDRSKAVRTVMNSMVVDGRIKTTDDDVIHYLNRMLRYKHTPEPTYLPINVLDQLVERMRTDDLAG